MAFTYVTVTHTFETAADTAAGGAVDFTPVTPMHNGLTVVKKTVTATLSALGAMSQLLAANTDPETTPTGTTYQVTERITGQATVTYYIQVPHNAGSSIDLRQLAGWQGATGSGGGSVSSINGEGPDVTGNVVLSSSDIGAQPADGDLTGLAGLGDGVPRRASGTWGLVTGTPDGSKFLRDDGTWAAASGSGYTSENARDDIAAALVAGPNITITPNDGADTITIQAATSGSSGIPASTVTTKGDLLAATGNAAVTRKSVGTDGQALLADSAQTTGIAWGAPVPADASVTNAKVATGAAISADKLADGTTNKVMTAAERTKLAGLSGASTVTVLNATDTIPAGLADGTIVLRKAPAVVYATLQTLTDNFATADSTKWSYASGTAVSGGVLVVTPANTTPYPTLSSRNFYDLTASRGHAQITGVTNTGTGTITCGMEFVAAAGAYGFAFDGFGLNAYYKDVGTETSVLYGTYNGTNHRWWRIREASGTVFWEVSANGTTWNAYASHAIVAAVSTLKATLWAGYYGTEPTPGTMTVDNFNL